jgi:two-component sensor histidine kinase/CHASE1-domain containing sensor protein
MLTIIVALHSKDMVDLGARKEFEFTCNEIKVNIVERLRGNAQILRSGVALFHASDTVSRDDWSVFTHTLQLEIDYPGIQGIGYSILIHPEDVERHTGELRSQGFPAYSIQPSGTRSMYTSIVYLEPFSGRNLRAFGYDMLSEPVRRAAMVRARDLDEPALSAKVILMQETEHDVQFGTLMYLPVYRRGEAVDTVEQRRAAIQGWVYSPYRMADLMRGTLRDWDVKLAGSSLVLQVYDGDDTTVDALMYDSRGSGDSAASAEPASLTRIIPVDFAGHRWTLSFSRFGALSAVSSYRVIWLIAVGGTVISLLLFMLALTIFRLRESAGQLALRLVERERAEAALRKLNEENSNLLVELQHRVKNSFNMICSLISLSSQTGEDTHNQEVLDELESRVRSVSDLYTLLYATGSVSDVWLDDYCRQVSETVVGLAGRVVLDSTLEPISVPAKTAAPIGLIVNELLTNAIKYAFPGERSGTIRLSLRKTPVGVLLEVADDGAGLPAGFDPAVTKGMGQGLVQALTEQIDGSFMMERAEPGTRCVLEFPLQSVPIA